MLHFVISLVSVRKIYRIEYGEKGSIYEDINPIHKLVISHTITLLIL